MRTGENIYKRKDGLWEGRYKAGFKSNGQAKYKSVYATTYTECKEKLQALQNKKTIPQDKKGVSMHVLYAAYIKHIKGHTKQSTLSSYENLYINHIGKAFDSFKVERISKEMIDTFLSDRVYHYSANYVLSIRTLLFSLLNYAYQENIILEKPKNIMKIRLPRNKVITFTDNETTAIESHILNSIDRIGLGVLITLYTGVRIGEICALKIYDIDLKIGILNINKTIQRIKNLENNGKAKTIVIIDRPKSDSSIREIPLPQFLLDILRDQLKGQNKNAYFLTGVLDKFIEPRSMENKFKKLLKDCRITNKTFHTLRHTFATVCVNENIFDIKTLSEVLGHENVEITLNRYVHSSTAVKRKQVQNLDKFFISRKKSCDETPTSVIN